jgi:hypothetical protein
VRWFRVLRLTYGAYKKQEFYGGIDHCDKGATEKFGQGTVS